MISYLIISLSLSTLKDAKQELAINLSGRTEFSHCAAGPFALRYLPPARAEAQ